MNQKEKYIVGVDGCKLGWVAVAIDENENYEVSKHPNFNSVISKYPNAEKYLVDMPIGLADENHPRTLEKLVREKLKPNKTSTVFTPPCRAAVYEKNYEAAKEKNKTITGKSISIQAWNIVPKIREVDIFLRENKNYIPKIYEAHPELCFAGLNEGQPMFFKKNKKEGVNERLVLLYQFFQKSQSIFEEGNQMFLKKEVKTDDLVDAMGLAVSGFLGLKNGFEFIPKKDFQQDIYGIPMRILNPTPAP